MKKLTYWAAQSKAQDGLDTIRALSERQCQRHAAPLARHYHRPTQHTVEYIDELDLVARCAEAEALVLGSLA